MSPRRRRSPMEFSADAVTYMVGGAIGIGIWLLRLEGKVKTQAKLHEEVLTELRYIRTRVDAIYNGRNKA